jgi:hypothetical protein
VAGAVLAVGLTVAAVLVFVSVGDIVSSEFERFTTAAPAVVELPAGAERTIYTGDPTADLGFFRADPRCDVVNLTTSEAVPTRAAGSLTLTLNGRTYHAARLFEVGPAGRYRVSCPLDSAQAIPMAVGPRIRIFRSVARIFAAVAVAFISLCGGGAILAVTAVKRDDARRRTPAWR